MFSGVKKLLESTVKDRRQVFRRVLKKGKTSGCWLPVASRNVDTSVVYFLFSPAETSHPGAACVECAAETLPKFLLPEAIFRIHAPVIFRSSTRFTRFPRNSLPVSAHCSSMSWLKLALFGCGLVATDVLCSQNVHSLHSEHSRESEGKALRTKWHTSCANEIFSWWPLTHWIIKGTPYFLYCATPIK